MVLFGVGRMSLVWRQVVSACQRVVHFSSDLLLSVCFMYAMDRGTLNVFVEVVPNLAILSTASFSSWPTWACTQCSLIEAPVLAKARRACMHLLTVLELHSMFVIASRAGWEST